MPSVLQSANNNRSSGTTGSTNGVQNGLPASKTKRGGSGGGTVRKGRVSGTSFTVLDTTIVNLDAAFEALANKSPWDEYAFNISGDWSLCANCQPDAAAKKLYRQYNFNRQLMGKAVVDAPIDNTEYCNAEFSEFAYTNTAGLISGDWSAGQITSPGAWVVVSVGKGMTNPLIFLPSTDNGQGQIGITPYSVWMEEIATAKRVPASGPTTHLDIALCCFTDNGAPGLRQFPFFVWIYS